MADRGRFCPNSNYGGIMSDGFFAEYAIVDARLCAKLSDKMTFQQVRLSPLTRYLGDPDPRLHP